MAEVYCSWQHGVGSNIYELGVVLPGPLNPEPFKHSWEAIIWADERGHRFTSGMAHEDLVEWAKEKRDHAAGKDLPLFKE